MNRNLVSLISFFLAFVFHFVKYSELVHVLFSRENYCFVELKKNKCRSLLMEIILYFTILAMSVMP